jgi:two-component sensor histidine kinase
VVEELYTSEQLAQMHQQLWQCVLEFANFSATQERNRIARDLHDSLGHALTALNFQLQTAIKLCKPDPNLAQEFLTEAHRLVAIATKEVRESVKELRNDALETQSLETLLESLVNDFHQTTGILPEVEINLPIALTSQLVTPIYRIIQEALNNTRKYAKATAVQIHICTTSTGVHFIIGDNGRGFDPQQVSGGYGLRGMQERVAVLQGHLQLETQPGAGCCITVDIPMHISNISEIDVTRNLYDSSGVGILSTLKNQGTGETFVPQNKQIHPTNMQCSEISSSKEYSAVSRHQSIKISEWQPLNLDEWQHLPSLEATSLTDMQSTWISSSDLPLDFQRISHHSIIWDD